MLGAEGHTAEARDILARLADQGDVEALTALGKSLLFHPPIDFQRGLDLIMRATHSHNAEALQMCAVMSAQGSGLPQDWGAALGYLEAGAEHGLATAQNELRLLASKQGNDWKRLRDSVDLPALACAGADATGAYAPAHRDRRKVSDSGILRLADRARQAEDRTGTGDR